MVLGEPRINRGKSPYEHENQAVDFIVETLPNADPYHLWALTELYDPSSQRLYELDAVILGYSALYVVEIKSYPGIISGDRLDWVWEDPSGRKRLVDSPIDGVNFKAKIIASRLRAGLEGRYVPWVQGLVFLSDSDVKIDLRDDGRLYVVGRSNFEDAICRHKFPGADKRARSHRIDRPTRDAVMRILREMGLKERAADLQVGQYRLGKVVDQGPGYRDFEAQHQERKQQRKRARVYLVSAATSTERRAQLRRAADREAQLLSDASGHENVLRYHEFIADAPLGPTILFDDFDNSQNIETFLRTHRELTFMDRAEIIQQVGSALEYCHRRGIFHGAVNPEAVLVRRGNGDRIEARLLNFQLGGSDDASVTRHISNLTSPTASLFMAPELRDGSGGLSPASDMFSLGALAYFVFTGAKPAANTDDLDARLLRDRGLDPRAVGDEVPTKLADLISEATALSIANRIDSVEFFLEELLEVATAPDKAAEGLIDPLIATKGAKLEGGFDVLGILGIGATARVLEVRYNGKEYALKVSLDASHDARIDSEAETLARINHPRIVQLDRAVRQPLLVGGRKALLMSVVGTETLYKKLLREGTVPIDYAVRYGEDLLDALAHLEDEGLSHRDIKPANLGVGASKVRKDSNRLTLFDFSLSQAPAEQVEIGTAAYRDPFLRNRKAWDAAADLWSAAVTLHEMLTGSRPSYGAGRLNPQDPEAELTLRSEAFDPAVRSHLDAFFRRALARNAADRYGTAVEMRRAWVSCFGADHVRPAGAVEVSEGDTKEIPDELIASIRPETPIGALPLSVRAINALDRAGVIQADDILHLPENRLSAIRGVGRGVAKQVLDFKRRWIELRKIQVGSAAPVASSYHGPDVAVTDLGLEARVSGALTDAGIFTTRSLANSEARHVAQLAQRNGFDVRDIKAALDKVETEADEREHPRTLEGWLKALLPPRTPRFAYARQLFGIENAFAGRLDVTGTEVAKKAGRTPPAIYLAVQRCGNDWRAHPSIGELRAMAHAIIERADGAVSLAKAAAAVLGQMPHDTSRPRNVLLAQAGALLRVVCEVEEDSEGRIVLGRLRGNVPWLCLDPDTLDVLKGLGKVADELATRYPPASFGDAYQRIQTAVQGTVFSKLPPDRLTELAVEASRNAARSSRLEIYVRGLDPSRAVKLTASVLVGGRLSVDEVKKRVRQRYPDAAELPDGAALGQLLEAEGLRWSEASQVYERQSSALYKSPETSHSDISRQHTALPSERFSMSPAALEARAFDEKLRTAVDRGRFCALKVIADQTPDAIKALASQLNVEPIALDQMLLATVREIAAAKGFTMKVVFEADRDGEASEDWAILKEVMEEAGDLIAKQLLPNRDKPLLLIQPGLAARFDLGDFLACFVRTAREENTRAIFLVVPCHDEPGPPRINGRLSIPELQPSQAFFVPRSWIENQHKRAA